MRTEYSPIERVRAEIDELFASDRPLIEVLEEVARLSVRLIMQSAVEAEVNAFLGRNRCQRAPAIPAFNLNDAPPRSEPAPLTASRHPGPLRRLRRRQPVVVRRSSHHSTAMARVDCSLEPTRLRPRGPGGVR